jgi:hypothetical protein
VAAEEAKADPLADAPRRHARADRVDDADDLVSRDNRPAGVGTDTFAGKEIAVAHPAGEDTQPDVAWLGFHDIALDQLELTLSRDLEGAIGRHKNP